MNIDIRRPQFSGTEQDKLQQMHSYLFQLVDQLQYAFSMVETSKSSEGGGTTVIQQTVTHNSNSPSPDSDATSFEALKNLIITSADIFNAYYEKTNEKLIASKEYVMHKGENGFDKFSEETQRKISENEYNISIEQENLQKLSGVFQDTDEAAYIKKSEGYIKAGFLSGDEYGVELGQRKVDENGVEALAGSARFTPGMIAFYDGVAYTEGSPTPSTYLSKKRLHTTEVEAADLFIEGGFENDSDDEGNIVTKWIGRGK